MIKVKPEFAEMPELVTVVDGKRVGLNKSFTATVPETGKKPKHTVEVVQATQAQLLQLFKEGSPILEEVVSDAKAEAKAEPQPFK